MIKDFLKNYFNIYGVTCLISILIAIYWKEAFKETIAYEKIAIGNLLISIFFYTSIMIFQSKNGRYWTNSLLGYIFLLPNIFIIWQVYPELFQNTMIFYLSFLIVLALYIIIIYFVKKKSKRELKELNSLLTKKRSSKKL